MKSLSRLETLIAEIVERPAWLLSPRKLHPLELTSALTRALEERAVRLADRVVAPDDYELRLNPADLAGIAELRPLLERELAEFVARTVAERDLACNRPPRVGIVEADDVRQGRIAVTARFSAEPARGRTVSGHRTGAASFAAAARRSEAERRDGTPRRAGAPRLELLGGRGEILEAYPLRFGTTTIGRRAGSDITLLDGKISRDHAQVELSADGATLSDLGSLNGTTINGELVRDARRLQPGDLIEIGRARLRFAAP
jgi:hypothetical protein